MNGKELRNAIKGHGFTYDEAASLLGISRQTLYRKLDAASIDAEFERELIEKLELSSQKVTTNSPQYEEIEKAITIESLKRENEMLKKDKEFMQKLLNALAKKEND